MCVGRGYIQKIRFTQPDKKSSRCLFAVFFFLDDTLFFIFLTSTRPLCLILLAPVSNFKRGVSERRLFCAFKRINDEIPARYIPSLYVNYRNYFSISLRLKRKKKKRKKRKKKKHPLSYNGIFHNITDSMCFCLPKQI